MESVLIKLFNTVYAGRGGCKSQEMEFGLQHKARMQEGTCWLQSGSPQALHKRLLYTKHKNFYWLVWLFSWAKRGGIATRSHGPVLPDDSWVMSFVLYCSYIYTLQDHSEQPNK